MVGAPSYIRVPPFINVPSNMRVPSYINILSYISIPYLIIVPSYLHPNSSESLLTLMYHQISESFSYISIHLILEFPLTLESPPT